MGAKFLIIGGGSDKHRKKSRKDPVGLDLCLRYYCEIKDLICSCLIAIS